MTIKNEMQGQKGYMKKVRDLYLADTKEMASAAFEKYQMEQGIELTKEFILDDIDTILKGLLVAETEIYNEKSKKVLSEVIPYYFENIYGKEDAKYPETTEYLNKMIKIFSVCKEGQLSKKNFIREISELMVQMVDSIVFSQKQSDKIRVGESLQNHLEKIFNICEIRHETQKQMDEGGTVMDFVIPGMGAMSIAEDQTINIECQTTLKDRFRLTTGKSTSSNVKRYLVTATGCGLITASDSKDLTLDKVKEIILDNNVTLVVFEEVKEMIKLMIEEQIEYLGKNKDKVLTINQNLCEKMLRLCESKIITFKQLLSRDIPVVMMYWNETGNDSIGENS